MEVDQEAAGCETQDQGKVTIPSEEQAGGSQPAAARSYECTFCKRGFTNAQALGGHMNIHRKEKAKLKQSTSLPSSKMPVEIPKIPTAARLPWGVSLEGHGHGRGENATLPMEETLVGEVRQLPLFIEKPSNMDRKLEVHQVISTKVASDQKMVSLLQHESIVSELDLELRLGHEPHNSTSSSDPTGNTRHFF